MGKIKTTARSVQKHYRKFRAVERAKDEVKAFTKREEEDDSKFMILFKKAGDDANDIERRLLKA